MVTKNEMVAILAALTTDLDKAGREADAEVRKQEEAHNDAAYFETGKTNYSERRHAS
jgi:hypothetical protein